MGADHTSPPADLPVPVDDVGVPAWSSGRASGSAFWPGAKAAG